MFYRFFRFLNRSFVLAIFWVYVAAFLIAFAFVFILPIVPLTMVFLGVAGLGFAVLTKRLLEGIEHSFARDYLDRHECPNCSARGLEEVIEPHGVRCAQCGSVFLSNGADYSYTNGLREAV